MFRRPAVRRTTRRTTRRVMRRTVRRVAVGGAVLLMVGGTAYKLSQKDVQKVEAQAGKPVEQMSEAELQAAMQRAGVQEIEMTPEDERAMENADREDAARSAAPAPAAPASAADEIEKLASLRDRGIISEEEFQARKQQILALP